MGRARIPWIRPGAFVMWMLLCSTWSAFGASRGLQVVDGESGKPLKLYQGGSYALVIGVSDYKKGWSDLPGVKKDIANVQIALKMQGFEVTVVENPTKAALDEALEKFRKQYGLDAENRLLFYYAGHGHTLKTMAGPMGYIVPADAPNPNQDERGFLTTAIDMEQIEGYAKRLQTKHALFLFDSCFSGSLFSLSREAPPRHITEKTSQPVRQFITAGDADETVPDQSIFAQQFLAALEGEADANRDGYLTGTELGEFLKERVINYSGSSQHPQYGKIRNPNLDKGDFVFKVTITVTSSASGTQVEVSSQPSDLEQRLAALEKQRMPGSSAPDPEAEMWNLVKDSTHVEDIRAFLRQHPQGRYSSAAQLKIQQLERQVALPPPSTALPPVSSPRQEPSAPSQFSRAQIREAQRLLKKVGLDPGPADGAFGQKTADALRHYQSQRDLPVTGVPDSATMNALELDSQQPQRPVKTEVQVAIAVPPPKPPPPPAPSAAATLRNSIGMEFVKIPPGDFLMGSSDGAPDQKPLRKVTISRPFYLGKYEVTQAQWMEVMGNNPSLFKEERKDGVNVGKEIGNFFKRIGNKEEHDTQERSAPQTATNVLERPVEQVSWVLIQDFILRLNQREGHEKYRLPTEAEWEYAARAGASGAYGESNDEGELVKAAWYLPNAEKITHPVGLRRPNAWGLYDMQGNVWEWVQDWWSPNYASAGAVDPKGPSTGTLRVLRGCSWVNVARQCYLSERGKNVPIAPHVTYGFRLARDLP